MTACTANHRHRGAYHKVTKQIHTLYTVQRALTNQTHLFSRSPRYNCGSLSDPLSRSVFTVGINLLYCVISHRGTIVSTSLSSLNLWPQISCLRCCKQMIIARWRIFVIVTFSVGLWPRNYKLHKPAFLTETCWHTNACAYVCSYAHVYGWTDGWMFKDNLTHTHTHSPVINLFQARVNKISTKYPKLLVRQHSIGGIIYSHLLVVGVKLTSTELSERTQDSWASKHHTLLTDAVKPNHSPSNQSSQWSHQLREVAVGRHHMQPIHRSWPLLSQNRGMQSRAKDGVRFNQ